MFEVHNWSMLTFHHSFYDDWLPVDIDSLILNPRNNFEPVGYVRFGTGWNLWTEFVGDSISLHRAMIDRTFDQSKSIKIFPCSFKCTPRNVVSLSRAFVDLIKVDLRWNRWLVTQELKWNLWSGQKRWNIISRQTLKPPYKEISFSSAVIKSDYLFAKANTPYANERKWIFVSTTTK